MTCTNCYEPLYIVLRLQRRKLVGTLF
jgi:hypothetical protein